MKLYKALVSIHHGNVLIEKGCTFALSQKEAQRYFEIGEMIEEAGEVTKVEEDVQSISIELAPEEHEGLKILYIGNFMFSFTTENHVAASLEELGCFVYRMQEETATFPQILEREKHFDFILYTRTWDNIMGDRNLFMRKKTKPLVGFSLDLWWGLKREKEVKEQLFFRSDYLFTADGGHQKEFKKANIEHFFLPPGVYGKEAYLGKIKTELIKDVIFVGSRQYHSEHPFRTELINWLEETYGGRFRLWGTNECVRGEALNNLYASAKVVLGDSCAGINYWSDRIPETLGRGGFLLHPKQRGITTEYEYNKHLVGYTRGKWAELKELIDYYLEHPIERDIIRLEGHEHVKNNCTYKHRMETMINKLEEVKAI